MTSAIEAAIAEENETDEKEPKEKLVLAGLTWVKPSICIHGVLKLLHLLLQPRGIFKRVHFILEWPFSLLRWMTIPPCCHVCLWCSMILIYASQPAGWSMVDISLLICSLFSNSNILYTASYLKGPLGCLYNNSGWCALSTTNHNPPHW